ncbi:MAG: GAF domain-containing protein [Terriglobales bacterium]
MDRHSTSEQGCASRSSSKLRGLPALATAAEGDLEATLQLLADRARYLTGASSVSIGLRSGAEVVCRASTGLAAPHLGSRLAVDSGLMGESLRLRKILVCDDAGKDKREAGINWRELGVKSVMVGPLIREGEAVGVFELLAGRPYAFGDQDVATLQRLSEMILTALEHLDAASRPLAQTSSPEPDTAKKIETAVAVSAAEPSTVSTSQEGTELQILPALNNEHSERSNAFNVRRCQACGFPVSESRTLCLDCEEAQSDQQTPAFLGHLSAAGEPKWLQAHLYTMGTLFIAALTVALLVFKLR